MLQALFCRILVTLYANLRKYKVIILKLWKFSNPGIPHVTFQHKNIKKNQKKGELESRFIWNDFL